MGVFTGGTSFRPGLVILDSRIFVPPLISFPCVISLVRFDIDIAFPGERGSGEAGKTNHVEEMQFLVSTFDFTLWTDKQLGVESRFVVAGSLSWIVRVTTFGFKTAQIGC